MITIDKRKARMYSMMGINPSLWSIAFPEIINRNPEIAVFTADLERYSGLERTFRAYPNICYNVGIAEQNMVGIAAGMAMRGIQTYMTTYAPFMALRDADQVRHLMGNLNLDMKAIGSAAGFSAGYSGASLLAINDIAFMRSIPNMVVMSPADCFEAIKMLIAASETTAPCYIRFCGTTNLPITYTEDYDFSIGQAVKLVEGENVAIIATGTNIVNNALNASEIIKEKTGIQVSVINMHTIKPLDEDCIRNLVRRHRIVCTAEEHTIIGGLGSAVAEVLTKEVLPLKQLFLGIQDKNYIMGDRQFMLEQAGLTPDKIAASIICQIL